MLLSVVLVNWNSRDDLERCLESLRAQTHRELEVVVVDNASSDGSVALVRERFPEVRVLPQSDNLGFAEGCNRGIAATTGPWVAMLNNDTVADPRWAEELVRAAVEVPAEVGMLQSLLLFQHAAETVNSTGIELTPTGRGRDRDEGQRWRAQREREEIFCPTAGAAAYRRAMLEAIRLPSGYFDPRHFCYYEDMDLGWRARLAGWSAFFVPTSQVLHRYHGSTSRRGNDWIFTIARQNRVRTLLKNASRRFLLTTAADSAYDALRLVWRGRLRGALGLAEAVRDGMSDRARVAGMAVVERAAVERAWVRRKR